MALAQDGAGPEIVGYLTGCADSAAAAPRFAAHPAYGLFADRFGAWPAHLHLNVAPDWRGRGVGAALVGAFAAALATKGVAGLHAVTAPGLRNVGFYRRNGFTHAETRRQGARAYLFLGRAL